MDLVYRQWSDKHHQVVYRINFETVVWTNNDAIIPVDFRIYDKDAEGKTKNGHFFNMLNRAEECGFSPNVVLFDAWYSSIKNLSIKNLSIKNLSIKNLSIKNLSIKNLKAIKKKGWHWLTRLKKNRLVNPDKTGNVAIELLTIPPEGMTGHLKKYGLLRHFGYYLDRDTQYCAADSLDIRKKKGKS